MLFSPWGFYAWKAHHDHVRQRNYGKVMFSVVSTCLSVHKGPCIRRWPQSSFYRVPEFENVQILPHFTRPSPKHVQTLFNLDLTLQGLASPRRHFQTWFTVKHLLSPSGRLAFYWDAFLILTSGDHHWDLIKFVHLRPYPLSPSVLTSSDARRSGRYAFYWNAFLLTTIRKEVDHSYVEMWTVNCCRRRMLPS